MLGNKQKNKRRAGVVGRPWAEEAWSSGKSRWS